MLIQSSVLFTLVLQYHYLLSHATNKQCGPTTCSTLECQGLSRSQIDNLSFSNLKTYSFLEDKLNFKLQCFGSRTLLLSLSRAVGRMEASYYAGQGYTNAALKGNVEISVYVHLRSMGKRHDGSEVKLDDKQIDREKFISSGGPGVNNRSRNSKPTIFLEYPDGFKSKFKSFGHSVYWIYEDEMRGPRLNSVEHAIKEVLDAPYIVVDRLDYYVEPVYPSRVCKQLTGSHECPKGNKCVYSDANGTWSCVKANAAKCDSPGYLYSKDHNACNYPLPPCVSLHHTYSLKRNYDGSCDTRVCGRLQKETGEKVQEKCAMGICINGYCDCSGTITTGPQCQYDVIDNFDEERGDLYERNFIYDPMHTYKHNLPLIDGCIAIIVMILLAPISYLLWIKYKFDED